MPIFKRRDDMDSNPDEGRQLFELAFPAPQVSDAAGTGPVLLSLIHI